MSRRPSNQRGFTLVELLVILAIIAVLIAILLPALSGARRAALQVDCQARIQQALAVMQNHSLTHQGYAPLVGLIAAPGITAGGLDDPVRIRYDYLSFSPFGVTDAMMSFTAALARDLGDPRLANAQSVNDLNVAEEDPNGFLKHFFCPAHLTDPGALWGPCLYFGNGSPGPVWLAWLQTQSYIYNEAALGWNDSLNRGRGQLNRVHSPSLTFAMADGLGGTTSRQVYPFSTVYNKVPFGPVTLADALAGNSKAGEPQNFDLPRHRAKINIGFFDGHVETRYITPSDLSNIYLIAP